MTRYRITDFLGVGGARKVRSANPTARPARLRIARRWLGRASAVSMVLAALGGCAGLETNGISQPIRAEVSRETERCLTLLRDLDAQLAMAGHRDAGTSPLAGFPQWRIDRFAAAWKDRLSAESLGPWLDYLRDLDRNARRAELSNAGLAGRAPDVERCAEALHARDRDDREAIITARTRASVPERYRTGMRVAGLYWFSSLPFSYGVAGLHERTRRTFAVPLDELAMEGRARRYLPEPRHPGVREESTLPALVASAMPSRPKKERTEAIRTLESLYAPVFHVDTVTADDHVGRPDWVQAPLGDGFDAVVEPGEPVVYTYPSWTFFAGAVRLQLNYVVWFPARPSTGIFDLLAGNIDGITWRVTLDDDGQVLFGDAMHNCGCYHMVFPGPGVSRRPTGTQWEEPLLDLPGPNGGPLRLDPRRERIEIRIAARTHYLQRLTIARTGAEGRAYRFAPYEDLRGLPRPDGSSASWFDESGLVPGTERKERWLFWPMGVTEPGAMRQRGHHAIAFVGRRHFDDADLFERHYRRASP